MRFLCPPPESLFINPTAAWCAGYRVFYSVFGFIVSAVLGRSPWPWGGPVALRGPGPAAVVMVFGNLIASGRGCNRSQQWPQPMCSQISARSSYTRHSCRLTDPAHYLFSSWSRYLGEVTLCARQVGPPFWACRLQPAPCWGTDIIKSPLLNR